MAPEQLSLDLAPRPPASPQVGDLVRAWVPVFTPGWFIGAPFEKTVYTYTGRLLGVVEAGELPTPYQVKQGWFGPRSRASKYRRVIIFPLQKERGRHLKAQVVKLTRGSRLVPLAEAESLR